MTEGSVNSVLARIQQNLKAPKNRLNKFAGYNYRNCEDILEAVKPLLGESILVVGDEIVDVGGRIYVKATATLTLRDEKINCSAFAREPESKKGSDESQITGAASSYARKYALNGLFLIDDTQDADATNDHGKGKSVVPMDKTEDKEVNKWHKGAVTDLGTATDMEYLKGLFSDFWKEAKAKKCTQEQMEQLKWQYDARKEYIERQVDDISFPGDR